ncbi:MAG: hypothetical protein ACKVWV_12885 [Planctomycetota bacterium]
MSAHQEIDLDIVGKLELLTERLQRTVDSVGYGLLRSGPPFDSKTVDYADLLVQLHPAWTQATSSQDVDARFRTWILSCGFRDVVEAVQLFASSSRDVLSAVHALANGLRVDSLGAWLDQDRKKRNEFARLGGLPKKLEGLGRVCGSQRSPLEPQMLSINRVRNCLVHDDGVVARGVANDKQSPLTMEWIGVCLVNYGAGEIRHKSELPAGGVIEITPVKRARTYEPNSTVLIGVQEFSEVCFTAFAFCQSLVELMFEHAESIGFRLNADQMSHWKRRCPIAIGVEVRGNDRRLLAAVEWVRGELRVDFDWRPE